MALKPKFKISEFDKIFNQVQNEAENQFIRILRRVGEMAVNEAKTNGNYQDRTANLRNSIGYVVAIDGVVFIEDFNTSRNGTKPSKESPVKYGKELAYEVAKSENGYALIVVAGMKYASYVESKGRVVLTNAEQFTNQYLPNLLKQLK